VNWKDRVVDHFPEFRMYDPWVTSNFLIEDLMAQHSGLPPYSGDLMAFLNYSRDEIIEKMRFILPVNTFRTDFAYQNNLFLVAGKIIENHSGLTWEENIEKEIFAALGMDDSSDTLEGYFETGNYVTTYGMYNEELTKIDFDGNSFKFAYIYGPAGGINSNIVDMSKWLSLQMNKGVFGDEVLLSRVQYDFLHRPATFAVSTDSRILFYCQGWIYEQRRDYRVFWHNGETLGCKTMVAYLPDDHLGIVVLSNLAGTELPELLAYVLFDLYKEVEFTDYSGESMKMLVDYKKTVPEEPEITFSDPLPLENYAGIYYNDFFEKVAVSVKEGHLAMELIGRDTTFDLEFFNRDSFVITNSDLFEMNGTVAAFSIDKTGVAESLTLRGALISKGLEILHRIE
jgi:CubicO group peptidase (beta-lactamase class C family)